MVVTRNRPSEEQPMLPVWSTNLWKEEIKRCRYNHLQGSEEGTYIPLSPILERQASVRTQLYSLKIIKYTWYSPKSLAGVFSQASPRPEPAILLQQFENAEHIHGNSSLQVSRDSTWALSRCVKIWSIWHNNIILLYPQQCFITL